MSTGRRDVVPFPVCESEKDGRNCNNLRESHNSLLTSHANCHAGHFRVLLDDGSVNQRGFDSKQYQCDSPMALLVERLTKEGKLAEVVPFQWWEEKEQPYEHYWRHGIKMYCFPSAALFTVKSYEAQVELLKLRDDGWRAMCASACTLNGRYGKSVSVVAYDEKWPAEFTAAVLRMKGRGGLGSGVPHMFDRDPVLAFHHIGSTAVPGLSAKPVIDIEMVLTTDADEQFRDFLFEDGKKTAAGQKSVKVSKWMKADLGNMGWLESASSDRYHQFYKVSFAFVCVSNRIYL